MARISNAKFPVRSKLVAVLLLPVTLLLALGGSQVVSVRQDAREARAEARLAAAVTGPGSFLKLVVDERNHTAVYLLDAEDLIRSVGPGRYLETRRLVDEARQEFLDFIAGEDEQVRAIYEPAMAAVEQLDQLRVDVDADTGTRSFQNVAAVQDLFARFGEVTGPLFDANRRVSLIVGEPALQRGAAIVDQSLRQSDTIALLTYSLVVAALAGDADGVNTGEEYVDVASLLRDLRSGEQIIRLNGEGDYAEMVAMLFASEHIQVYPELVATALDSGAPDVGGLFANAGNEDAFGYDKLREAAEEQIGQAVDDINGDAQQTQTTFTVVGLAVLLVLATVTTLVARSITRPLRSLTQQAMAMAGERLPSAVQGILDAPPSETIEAPRLEPIDIRTRDEVSDVAQALTTVQDSALGLATEQAALRRNISDSFVHLGRRNQTLLGRQLDFITELEQTETDPNTLANLFRLDHLATRMRRNAESLLVLAGLKPPRVWRVPVMVSDVVRAALSETENYERVEILGVEPAAVVGSAVADLAHLLAELVENAIAFSPPHLRVEISGRYRPLDPYAGDRGLPPSAREDGAFTITVADSGIGMTAEAVGRANQRLAGQESFAVAPSQYLGHYVAGMIARRHGITVRLDSSGHRGTTATVTLPPSLLSSPEESSVPVPAGPGAYAAPPVPAAPTPIATRGFHPGGRAALAPTIDTYRVGEAEFYIDFGTLHQPEAPPPTAPGPAPGLPTGRARPAASAIDRTAIGEAQRARYVRDTLSKFSAGLEKGRYASAREQDERAVGPDGPDGPGAEPPSPAPADGSGEAPPPPSQGAGTAADDQAG
ncbi:MAG TPA: ATP-binding protein [Acidimicrobiales bacterium]|nr:ATP-binding protein [Acidimicrobiales bacterium]